MSKIIGSNEGFGDKNVELVTTNFSPIRSSPKEYFKTQLDDAVTQITGLGGDDAKEISGLIFPAVESVYTQTGNSWNHLTLTDITKSIDSANENLPSVSFPKFIIYACEILYKIGGSIPEPKKEQLEILYRLGAQAYKLATDTIAYLGFTSPSTECLSFAQNNVPELGMCIRTVVRDLRPNLPNEASRIKNQFHIFYFNSR